MTPVTDAEELRAALDRRCLVGLVAAAGALVGDDARAVCASFEAWRRSEGRRSWPWLPGLCFAALEPLEVSFPDQDAAAVTLGRVIVGAETDAWRVEEALRLVGGPTVPRPPLPVGGADLGLELRRRSLEIAVDRFWEELRAAAERLHDPVVRGDRPRADALVVTTRRRLEGTAQRIEALAGRVVAHVESASPGERAPPEGAPPRAAVVPAPDAAGWAMPTPRIPPPAPSGDRVPSPERPGTEIGRDRGRGADRLTIDPAVGAQDDEAEDRSHGDDGDVEYRRVRERPLAPVVFLAGVTLGALVWLLIIARNGG